MSWTRFGQLSAETQTLVGVQWSGTPNALNAISSTQKYTGNYSYRFSGSAAGPGFAGELGAAVRCGFFFWHNGTQTTWAPVVGLKVGIASLVFRAGTNSVSLVAGYLNGGSTANEPIAPATTTVLNSLNTWIHIGLMAYIAEENGFVSFYGNGERLLKWTGDTRIYARNNVALQTTISGVYAGGYGQNYFYLVSDSWSQYVYTDDMYADLWTGESPPPDEPPPSRRFLAAFPNAAGSSSQWTPSAGTNWQNVDEAPPNAETDFNKALAPNLLDLYAHAAMEIPVDHAVRALIPLAYARKSDAGTQSQAKVVLTNSLGTVESSASDLPVSYGYIWNRWTEQPDGATPWDETAVNATEFGIKSAGTF